MSDNSGLIVNALQKTDSRLATSIDAGNSWRAEIKQRGARIKLYRDYERGDHRANMTAQMKKMLRLNSGDEELNELNVNYCKVIIDKMASRAFVSNIQVDSDSAEEWLMETLARNDFDAQQGEWYRGAIRDGDSYVMVDPETILWTSEPAYDGFDGVVVIFDSMTRKPVWACKLWSEATQPTMGSGNISIKIVVYQPDSISYWQGMAGGMEVEPDNIVPIDLIVDRGSGFAAVINSELNYTNMQPWPLERIPLVAFANQKDNYTSYGESEIRVAIPLQDSLNRTQHSKILASEFSAFKLLWSIGFEIDVDGILPGGVVNLVLKDSEGHIVTDLSDAQIEFLKTAKVGQFEASDISQYTNQIEKETQQISQVTQTPIYGVTAQGNLSGEALKQLEIGLLGKIERFQHQNADAIKELIELTAAMQNEFDVPELGTVPPFETVKVIWKSPEILDVNQRVQALATIYEKMPGLFDNEFYAQRIGVLLQMNQADIQNEIEKAQNQRGLLFDALVGAGGGIPVV